LINPVLLDKSKPFSKAKALEIGLFIYRQQDEVLLRDFEMGKINNSLSFKLAPLYTD
jgi:hypothetical protein